MKLLIGLHTDSRAAFPGDKLKSVLLGALDEVVVSEDNLISALEQYRLANPTEAAPRSG
jgi:hypothetical protein